MATGQLVFSAIISYGASRFFSKKISSPPAMSYDKFCTVPKGLFDWCQF